MLRNFRQERPTTISYVTRRHLTTVPLRNTITILCLTVDVLFFNISHNCTI